MIDLHQHPWDKTVEEVLAHTEALGGRKSVLLGVSSEGPEEAVRHTEECRKAAGDHAEEFLWFCAPDPRDGTAVKRVREWAQAGACGFGEHKVDLSCDDPRSIALYRLAGSLGLPVLVHFEDAHYNTGFERFEAVLKELPRTLFIGHAQTWWANISAVDRGRSDYPKEKVVPGGLTDRWLATYPNLYADLSAGSGLNACERDPAFYRGFLRRHRRKLLFGTDCPCRDGRGGGMEGGVCLGRRMLARLGELRESEEAFEDITEGNLKRLLRIA